MLAKDINAYLRSLVAVKEPSVDRVIVGDPLAEVRKIGVAWLPYWQTCREAVAMGVNVLVVHEPTFYTHWDQDREVVYPETAAEKKQWLEQSGLVIIRCHDVLDKIDAPFGIPFAFGAGLGFPDDAIIRSTTYYNVYRCDPVPAQEMARRIAHKLKDIGQPGVAFYGDGERIVESVGLGTGMICDPITYAHLKPDMFIAIDDLIRTWTQGTLSRDTGLPLVVVNHGASEEFGVRALHRHLASAFPELEVIHFQQGCAYHWITG